MEIIKSFKSKNGEILFEVEKSYWCKITLLQKDKKIYLGADAIHIIKEKLLNALQEKIEKSKFKLENNEIVWCISLLETYTSIFITINFPKTLYFLYKDKDMNDFDKLELDNSEFNNLQEFLEKLI